MHTLLTKHCFLRDYGEGDFEEFLALQQDVRARAHLGPPLSRSEAEEMFRDTVWNTDPRAGWRWAVFDRKTDAYWGHVFLVPWEFPGQMEWGIVVVPELWAGEIPDEIGEASLHHAFGLLRLEQVLATAELEESPWQRLIIRLGMSRIQRCRDDFGIYDVYGLSKGDLGDGFSK